MICFFRLITPGRTTLSPSTVGGGGGGGGGGGVDESELFAPTEEEASVESARGGRGHDHGHAESRARFEDDFRRTRVFVVGIPETITW